MFRYYKDALEQVFQFYASGADVVTRGGGAKDAVPELGSSAGSSARSVRSGLASPARRGLGGATNSMKNALGYKEFLKFASDFELSNSVILSTLELGDIYLSSLHDVAPDSRIRKLSFSEFWEALVRCALIAYSKISDATVIDKIRGLFLYMWRAINKNVPKAFSHQRAVSTYAGDLIAGAMLFNKRFTAQWQRDGFRDYLNPEVAKEESGRDVLRRIMGRSAGGDDGEGTRALLDASAADLMAGAGAGAVDGRAASGGRGMGTRMGMDMGAPEAPVAVETGGSGGRGRFGGSSGIGPGPGPGAGAGAATGSRSSPSDWRVGPGPGPSTLVASVLGNSHGLDGEGGSRGEEGGRSGMGMGMDGAEGGMGGGRVHVPGGPLDGALPVPPSGAGDRHPWEGMVGGGGIGM